MITFTTPVGTRDLIKQESQTRRTLQSTLMNIFDHWGYEEVVTPMVEYYSTFSIANMKEQEVYKILDASNRILTLRSDMTIPIARVAATKFKDEPLPLRFQYSANVFKVKEELSGNQNESTDCGVELLGVEEPYGDLEILACALDALSVCDGLHYTLEIGNLNFFQAACSVLQLDEATRNTLADLINRKSLKSLNDYVDGLDLEETHKNFFKQLPWLCGTTDILENAKAIAFHDDLKQIIRQLTALCEQLKSLGYEEEITIDLGKIPRLTYYTGLIFEAFVEGVGISILSGGRYDQLVKRFGRELPAIGFAIRLDALLEVINLPQTTTRKIVSYPSNKQVEALQLAKELRTAAIVELILNDELTELEVSEGGSTSC